MTSRKFALLSTTVIPLAVVAGVAVGGMAIGGQVALQPAYAACNPCNPCAAANPCNPCNPCASANPCSPCNPCNPCAAGACNPCNPCAAGGGSASLKCAVPRLQSAAANPCNPCAAANPCNPCNPCAAANPCTPCAAANPCNPCAAANPCNPCAAANPCNPCGACNPCNPCAAGGEVELTDAEAAAAYDCLLDEMRAAYAKSDNAIAAIYAGWKNYSSQAYVSGTHGGRYVMNYADERAKSYATYETGGAMPVGAQLAKDSFSVKGNGQVAVGPLFIMEKMQAGFNAESDDWRYTMVMPNGSVFGTTNGAGSDKVAFCIGCHQAGAERDSMLFLPEEYRVSGN